MPQPYNQAVITDKGVNLLARAQAGETKIEFTRVAIGAGTYESEEKQPELLKGQESLKEEKNSYAISSVDVSGNYSVRIKVLITNQDPTTEEVLVSEGYYINEIGLYAKEKDGSDGTEILYSIAVTSGEMGDFMPPYNGSSPTQIIQEYYATVNNSSEITIQSNMGAPALADDLHEVMEDVKEIQTPEFSQAEERENIESRDAFRIILGKIKKVFADLKNVAFSGNYNDLVDKPTIPAAIRVKGNAEADYHTGDVNITPANIGLGNVGNFKGVSTMASQGLSETEKSNARINISAAPTSHASTATTYGASSSTNYGHAMASSTTPKANGLAAVGSETTKFARGDHVHPLQTSVTGNAATATKLATARTIRTNLASTSTASFDGSANITPGVSGVLPIANGGTGNTSGNAPTANKAARDWNGNNIVDTYETKAGNTWKKIKTIAYNGTATASRVVYKELKIVAYRTAGNGAVVHGIYDFPTSIFDNFAGNALYFGDTSVMDAYFYATLNGNTVIVGNEYKGMTIELYGK